MLENKETGCSLLNVNFNRHDRRHLIRAAQEGIVFSFKYGIDIMEGMGIPVKKIHAGHANMFLSPIFRDTLAGVTGATIELYDTDGAAGAARGGGLGAGIYQNTEEAFSNLERIAVIGYFKSRTIPGGLRKLETGTGAPDTIIRNDKRQKQEQIIQ